MTPDRLLQHFEAISEAEDAVPSLRRFILNLAVRGKLVEQDPNDEPASELLKRIGAEKASLVKVRKIAKERPLPPIGLAEFPYQLPKGWSLARFGEVYSLEYGDNLPAEKRSNTGEYPVYGSNGVVGSHCECFVKSPCIVVGRKGSAGALNLSLSEGCCVTDVAYYCVPPRALEMAFSFKLFHTLGLDSLGKGIKPGLNRNEVYVLPIALPPLAEQHRIVAKVDELMALCNELEAARTKRESHRDHLVAATLHRLNNGDTGPEGGNGTDIKETARFYFNHLPRLATRPEHIKQLRQTTLNLAVQGKLVPQDTNDEPAFELLKRLREEKGWSENERKVRKGKALAEIHDSIFPFDIPRGWAWVRLGELSQMVTSGSRDWARYYVDDGAIFVRMGNLSRGSYRLRLENIQRVNPPADSEGARTKLEEGDILISITGEVGLLGLIPPNFGEAYINQHTCLVRPKSALNSRYLPELFRSPFAQVQFNEPQRGIKNSFRLTDVTQLLVPLPPLAEQHRIVAKMDELMVLCDELEAQLTASATTRRQLLEAIIYEALSGSIDHKLAARLAS